MADSTHIRSFIQKWEGGLSRNPSDKASAAPAPWSYKGQTGWHTNKGITYTTFLSLSKLLGYEPSAENFFLMPDKIWNAIFKAGYWDAWRLDDLRSQALADVIADFSWGSGVAGSFNSIKKFLAAKGKKVTTRDEAVKALNELSFLNEQNLFSELMDHRENFFKSLNQPTFLKGWLNRMADLRAFGEQTILKKK